MRYIALCFHFFSLLTCVGQWQVPARIELDGAQAADRQVVGVADPVGGDAAVTVDAARDNVTSFTSVTGTQVLSGALSPAPLSYSAGMVVTILPTAANHASAQLDLNGLGAQDILKAGELPLDSADLTPGVPVRLIHDGTRFRIVGTTYLPCPEGYHIGGREFCIEDVSRSDTTFYAANRICRDANARLCTFGEWVFACRKDPAFLPTVLDYEWVDSAANNTQGAKMVGNGNDGTPTGPYFISCEHGYQAAVGTASTGYRCCKHR